MGSLLNSKAKCLDLSERLKSVPEFNILDETERRIVIEHVNFPHFTKEELAGRLGLKKLAVYTFFHSKAWDVVNLELASQQVRELIQLSVKTLRDILICAKPDVKLKAAVHVLANFEVLKAQPKTVNDNKIQVVWNDSGAGNVPLEQKVFNADSDTIHPPCEAAGDTR